MPGSAGDPVRLDPAQHVVEVGWPRASGPALSVNAFLTFSVPEGCGDWPSGVEMLSSDHATVYILGSTIDYSAGADGSTYSIRPSGGGAPVDCIQSSGSDSMFQAFGDWVYSGIADDPDYGGDITASGTEMALVLNNVGELDGSPLCRFRLFPLASSISAAYLTPGAPATASGAVIDISAITMTEIGGLGRVFHPVAVTGGTFSGSGNGPWLHIFNIIWG
jgi:hypothetical protein